MISNKFTLHSISSSVYRYSCFIQTPTVQLIHKIPKYAWYVPCFLAAVQDTADGFDEVQESTMPEWDQWFFSFLSVLSVWILSGALGYPLTLVEEIGPVAIPVSSLLLFPVLLLSAMECELFCCRSPARAGEPRRRVAGLDCFLPGLDGRVGRLVLS